MFLLARGNFHYLKVVIQLLWTGPPRFCDVVSSLMSMRRYDEQDFLSRNLDFKYRDIYTFRSQQLL